MWQEPIVNDRVKTALEEGITSQSAARVKREQSGGNSILSGLLHSLTRLWRKEPRPTWDPQDSIRFHQTKETIK